MEEPKIVYKRNSTWWIATCYLLGTLFLVVYAAISLLGFFTDIGVSGIKAISESSEETRLMQSLAAKIKKDVQLVGYKVEETSGDNYLTVSIDNRSEYSLGFLHIEIAALDPQGLPSYTRDVWLTDLQTVFPGDTAHARVKLPARINNQNMKYTVRISDFSILGDHALDEYCQ